VESIKNHSFIIEKAPISVSAFLTETMTRNILNNIDRSKIDIVLLPGFVQWDTLSLEQEFSLAIRKGPEFASSIPAVINNLGKLNLSNKIAANKLIESSGEEFYNKLVRNQYEIASEQLGNHTFFMNEKKPELMIGRNLPPPIIAEIVNCTEKDDNSILRKANHYLRSGADIIDIGCVSNKPNPQRVREIVKLLRHDFDVLLSIDSMNTDEILAAVDEGIDLILSIDLGNYNNFTDIPKNLPIVILPTKINEGYFPKEPDIRVKNLLELTRKLKNLGFQKLIADPLLETPISPGICRSLETYMLYKKTVALDENQDLELPMFFGISNVVELMDIDSVGINGLLASIAIELDMGILFTVEHSTKMMGGVAELKQCTKLNYISKFRKTPPINQGIQIFKAKGKVSQEIPEFDDRVATVVNSFNSSYEPDPSGYFKIHINHYAGKIYIFHFSNKDELKNILIGKSAEGISKKVIELKLTEILSHINYLGRELAKAENCLLTGAPYIQDD